MPTHTRSRPKLPGSEPQEKFDEQTDENEDRQTESSRWRSEYELGASDEKKIKKSSKRTVENDNITVKSMPCITTSETEIAGATTGTPRAGVAHRAFRSSVRP
jgi:hypothetical protein